VTPDPETVAMADALRATMDQTLDVEIGTLETPLDSRRNVVRAEESTMGNLIADAMRDATGADIAIMNGGGIRGDTTYDAGRKLTRRDILTELPFGNVTVVTELPGSQVLLALENGVSQVEKGAGRFAQVSGLTFAFDAVGGSRAAGSAKSWWAARRWRRTSSTRWRSTTTSLAAATAMRRWAAGGS
jgi:5'-nucleotidase/UDP-sugar diphosphatase